MDEILDEKTYETRAVVFASFVLRTAAFLMDILLIVILSYGLNYSLKLAPSYLFFLKIYWWKIMPVLFLYYTYFEGGEGNATLGKQIMNMRVLNEEKRDIDYLTAAKHLLLSVVLFFGYLTLLTNDKRQTLADKICKVIVIKVR